MSERSEPISWHSAPGLIAARSEARTGMSEREGTQRERGATGRSGH